MRCTRKIQLLAAAVSALFLSGCSTAKITGARKMGEAPNAQSGTIYVAKIEFGDECSFNAPSSGGDEISDRRADMLQERMTESLVASINKAGFRAARIGASTPLPSEGCLVRGRFVAVQSGSASRRALLGFGAGREKVQVICSVCCLQKPGGEPFYEVEAEAGTGRSPGSLMLPIPMFVGISLAAEENRLETDVEKAAEAIAAQLSARLRGE